MQYICVSFLAKSQLRERGVCAAAARQLAAKVTLHCLRAERASVALRAAIWHTRSLACDARWGGDTIPPTRPTLLDRAWKVQKYSHPSAGCAKDVERKARRNGPETSARRRTSGSKKERRKRVFGS